VNWRPPFGRRLTMLKLSGSPDSALTTVPRSDACCAVASGAYSRGISNITTDARGESRTLMGLPPTDFESVASAIPPLGRGAEIYAGNTRGRKVGGDFPSSRPTVNP